ncbi:MAG: ribonuclease J [Spirochaetes bacterium RBG_16_49_21]|nr:MAG: ribonuclease J [Spirochaetes bacterium RBG_16_49_21]
MENDKAIKIIPLGGLGAIGKNITLFEFKDDILIVDCGIMFPTDEMPGIDYIIPDFTYIRKNKAKVKAILVTHGHEDHIGAVPYLLREINAPIYATKLSIGLIQSRLEELPPKKKPQFVEIKPRDRRQIGSFSVEFIKVNHSIIGGIGLALQTEVGTIIHTGDFKIDFSPVDGDVTDIFRFADYGEKGVLLLMSDSTNAERSGFTQSESVLIDKLADIFSSSRGRIIVATFASNIHRVQQVMEVAQRFNRKIAISGHTMLKNVEIANSLGYLNYRDDLLVDLSKSNTLPNKKLVIIGTGSQGEPMSALYRMAYGTHRHITAEKGDTVVITASVIPGNERMVTNVVNSLMKLGAEVYYDQDEGIHVSGHGSAKELKLMLAVTKPRFFMPIHGEYRHLKAHAGIAESLNIKPSRILIAENGDVLELTSKSFRKIDSIDISQIYVDGQDIGDIESGVIKDRHVMSSDGIIVIVIVISEGMLARQPDIFSRGFVGNKEDTIVELIRKDVHERVNRLLVEKKLNDDIVSSLKKGLRNFIFKLTRRNPLIIVEILKV